ncbi:uncharacterized protein LOC128743165 [Sabethes cyaneus]|uniref:uncharacterized protein LOC128743165 n=1 Tax=Sabethes cyaneus TaxID=53552 RepID=UPI00237D52E4|nr:uncharacterized protein LOC128743165 [Sabethes cyaneus]
MSPKKPVDVNKVLPTDSGLKQRNIVWRNIMDKYSNNSEEKAFDIDKIIEACDENASDKSLVSDVESISGADSDQENCAEISKQLSAIVPKRQKKWKTSGLAKLMEKTEDQTQQGNLLSHQKVQEWLMGRFPGMEQNIFKGQETIMSERNEDGDQMRFHRKQQLAVASKMDSDSMYSLDSTKYVLSNAGKKTYSKVVTTTIEQYTLNPSNGVPVKLHSISAFPAIEANPLSALKLGRNISKSDSLAIDANHRKNDEKQSQEVVQFVKPLEPRRKIFKKTKTKNSKRSPSSKAASNREYEQAVQKAVRVSKIPAGKTKKCRIRWMEDSNSSTSENDEVFTQNSAKRALPATQSDSDSAESSVIPSKKASPSQMKALVEPFGAIALSPKKKTSHRSLDFTSQNDQTTNLTAQFAAENPKLVNSTEINNCTTQSNGIRTGPQPPNGHGTSVEKPLILWVYKPQTIDLSLSREEKVRITVKDLDLSEVTKPRHLAKFKKFTCLIHPNSSVQFVPSDSEDDIPKPMLSAKTRQLMEQDDDSESLDEDDPIMNYNPRYTDRLNLRECPTWLN